MKILAVDSSAVAASCAVIEDEKLLCESFLNRKLTHSQTLLSMLERMMEWSGLSLKEIDQFAVAAGPGSFTGLRIGIGAIKGIAYTLKRQVTAVSTLEGLAHNLIGFPGLICPVMDARCEQVYTALFSGDDGKVLRKWEDQAISLNELARRLLEYSSPVTFVGDGAELCFQAFSGGDLQIALAPAALRFQKASSVALAAVGKAPCSAEELAPSYLRLPQAQRELLARQERKK